MPAWPCEHDSLVVVVTVVVIDQELMPVIRIPFAVTGPTEYYTIFHFPLVRPSVTGVTSQFFSMILWFRPSKP